MRGHRRPRLYAYLILLGCGDPGAPEHETIAFGEVRELADDACENVGHVRVCFDGPRVVRSITPAPPPDALWRCSAGRCALIERRPFECEAGQCRQRYARMPDDADWECADVRGLVVCRDRAAPAGMVPGEPELGWICGDGSPRICVDLAPDRPGAGNYDCSFEHEPIPQRVCREIDEPTLGGPCRGECPEGMVCVEGTCVPRVRPAPDCWTDANCEQGERCVLATCSR